MSPIWGVTVAVAGVLTGLAWQSEAGRSMDLSCFHAIDHMRMKKGLDQILIFARPLGTKWFLILFLVFVFIWQMEVVVSLAIASLLTAAIERGIKLIVNRPRPFVHDAATIVRQNPRPMDPSFPSGDVTRIWFIFAAVVFGLHLSLIWSVLAGICAVVVSFSRVRLGVHYPFDVWAGIGLGLGLGMIWSSFVI